MPDQLNLDELIGLQEAYAQREARRQWAQMQAQMQAQIPEPEAPAVVPKEDEDMKLINPFLVGCDPEFIVLDNAGKHMNMRTSFPHHGLIGWDHEGDVLEVRPAPARSVVTLLKHIRNAFKITAEYAKFPGELRAGACFQTGKRFIGLGGHVHLDVPYNIVTNSLLTKQIQAMDEFTKLLEHRDILPKQECLDRRSRVGYGSYSDVRRADDSNRLEYRTMASWLFSPITSYVCLTGAKLAAAQPDAVTEALTGPKAKLTKMFGRFANEDMDAARVSELILENGVKLQRDPDANLLTVWDKNSSELKTLEIHD